MTSEGVCACAAQPTGTPCNTSCQGGFLNVELSVTGSITISQGADSTSVALADLPNTMGTPSCSALNCKVVSVVGGGITSFEPANKFIDLFKSTFSWYSSSVRLLGNEARELVDITTFSSPVICITAGTTIAFDTSAGNYPVYMKDSMLNTNEFFDYSEF